MRIAAQRRRRAGACIRRKSCGVRWRSLMVGGGAEGRGSNGPRGDRRLETGDWRPQAETEDQTGDWRLETGTKPNYF